MYHRGSLPFSRPEATLDISKLAPGSYFLILGQGQERHRARFVVER